jgi:protein-S-isoprenylcysteine O-methyltransferase Ste14
MRATRFEFEQRFWIIGAIFWLGFGLAFFDHTNFAMATLHLLAPSINPDSARGIFWLRLILGAGAILIFLAALLRTSATAFLRTTVVHDARQHSEVLVAGGPYRYVRNPLYLANIFLVAGLGVMASRLGWGFMVLAMWLFVYRLILREEEGLRREQGDSYAAYLKAVPRLWPSVVPRIPASAEQPRWGQAIAGEMFIWIIGLGVLCFAITLDFKLTTIAFVCSFAVYFIAVSVIKKRAAPSHP